MGEARRSLDQWVPGVAIARRYERRWLRSDVVAGVVLAAILVPQGMAYAELAGVPPVNGLYTTIGCLVGYALFGPSRVLVLGPDSSVSPMIFAALVPLLAGGGASREITLAAMLALLVGLIEIALGVLRLGFVAELLSSEVKVGYLNGLAVVIVVGQLPKLCGFSTNAEGFFHELQAFANGLDDLVPAALAVGLGVLVILAVLPRISGRIPAVLVAIVAATLVSGLAGLAAHGVPTVGPLPRGIPRPSVPWTSVHDAGPLLVAALGITLVSLADTIATASSFAARRGEGVDADQEMIGIGAANLGASLLQGFAVSTSLSRTAVAERAGARSQLTSVVGASLVVLMLVFLNSLLKDLPQSALAAVLIGAAATLVDVQALRRYRRIRPSSLLLSLVASLGVILLGVLQGIVVAVVLGILLYFRRGWQPHGAVLGRVDGMVGWHDVARYPSARQLDRVLVYRWEAPLFFANAARFRDELVRLAADRDAEWIVVQAGAVTDVDPSAAEQLEELDERLNAKDVHLAFVGMRDRIRDLLADYGLLDTIDRTRFYLSVEDALQDIDRKR